MQAITFALNRPCQYLTSNCQNTSTANASADNRSSSSGFCTWKNRIESYSFVPFPRDFFKMDGTALAEF